MIYEQQPFQESIRVELKSPASMAAFSEMHRDPVIPELLCTFRELEACLSSMGLFWPSKSFYESEPQIPPLKKVMAPFLPNV